MVRVLVLSIGMPPLRRRETRGTSSMRSPGVVAYGPTLDQHR